MARTAQHAAQRFSLWSTYKVLPQLTVAAAVGQGVWQLGLDQERGRYAQARWVPSYWRFDAMAAYEFNDHISAQLNVLNGVFDKTYYTRPTRRTTRRHRHRAALLSLRVKCTIASIIRK